MVGQIQKLSQDSCAVRDTLRQARLQATQQVERLKLEKLSLELMVHQAIGYVAGFDAWLAAYRHRHLVRILNHLFSAVAS